MPDLACRRSILLLCAMATFGTWRSVGADGRKEKDHSLVSEGGLKYVLQEPEKKTGGVAPLVIMLHGTGGGTEYFRVWIQACRKRGWYVALPESSGCGTPASGNTSGDSLKRWDAVDIPNVLGLAREIMSRQPIDRRRVAILGFSNGGYYASRIGLGNPDLFQSVVCIAGGIGGRGWTDRSCTMGVYIIHGTADTSVPVEKGRALAEDLKADGFKNVVLKEFPGRDHETFPEESEACLKWLDGQKRAFAPGSVESLAWTDAEAGFETAKSSGRKILLYLYSVKDADSDVAVSLEWGTFVDTAISEAAKDLICIKVDRDTQAELVKRLAVKGPQALLLDPDQKVLERIDKVCSPAEVAARLKKRMTR